MDFVSVDARSVIDGSLWPAAVWMPFLSDSLVRFPDSPVRFPNGLVQFPDSLVHSLLFLHEYMSWWDELASMLRLIANISAYRPSR